MYKVSNTELLNKDIKEDNSTPSFNSVGQILCYYRKLNNISLEEIAEKTRIKSKYLYCLEQDITDSMPSPVYVYSYIKHYAKQLGLEGNELVKLYQRQFDISENIIVASDINSSKIGSDSEIIFLQEKDILELSNNNGNNGHDSLDSLNELYGNTPNNELNQSLEQVKPHQENQNNMHVQNIYENTSMPENVPQEREPVITQEIVDASAQAERIILNARREAERIVKEARQDSIQLRFEAEQYASTLLANLENDLTIVLNQVRNGKEFIKSQKK